MTMEVAAIVEILPPLAADFRGILAKKQYIL
jgi:hypothetical protein